MVRTEPTQQAPQNDKQDELRLSMHCWVKVEAVGVKELARKDSHPVRGVVREVDVAEERCLQCLLGEDDCIMAEEVLDAL